MCEKCSKKIDEQSNTNHSLVDINTEKEIKKEKFLKSFSKILEFYLFKFNFLFSL